MAKTERELLNKTALTVFTALMAKESAATVKERAVEAWRAAEEFVRARRQGRENQYSLILDKHEGAEALRRILKLDGTRGRAIDFFVERYAGKADPLAAYADDFGGRKTEGQTAIAARRQGAA